MLQTNSLSSTSDVYSVTGRSETTRNNTAPFGFQRAVAHVASIFSNIDRLLLCRCIPQPETLNGVGCFSFLKKGRSEQSEPSTSLAQGLVTLSSAEGTKRLRQAKVLSDFPMLANQFEPQFVNVSCGATSAAIVLNALRAPDPSLPRDASRLRPEDSKHKPEHSDFTVPRFTQEILLDSGSKTRSQVFGQPVIDNAQEVSAFGYQLDELSQVLQAQGATTKVTIVNEQLNNDAVKKQLITILKQPHHYVIAAYKRDAVGQHGGGHFSPLGAYDSTSDSFLVMDVNPSSALWVWMPSATLIRGMRTLDSCSNRGFISVSL